MLREETDLDALGNASHLSPSNSAGSRR
jgi:hypothetical protein